MFCGAPNVFSCVVGEVETVSFTLKGGTFFSWRLSSIVSTEDRSNTPFSSSIVFDVLCDPFLLCASIISSESTGSLLILINIRFRSASKSGS